MIRLFSISTILKRIHTLNPCTKSVQAGVGAGKRYAQEGCRGRCRVNACAVGQGHLASIAQLGLGLDRIALQKDFDQGHRHEQLGRTGLSLETSPQSSSPP
jgi:hypothetical protein